MKIQRIELLRVTADKGESLEEIEGTLNALQDIKVLDVLNREEKADPFDIEILRTVEVYPDTVK